MTEIGDDKARNREIAENESARQTTSAARLSIWAISAAAIAALIVFGWLFGR